MITFPSDFLWGAATSSYQIEGATAADGRGPSIWDTFCREPGRIENGETGDVACDHYHRYAEDVALMGRLGLRGYRFSIAWPRILPTGRGPVNQAGIDFYSRLVDALLQRGIEPAATLYHWDLPQALEHQGGWLNRDTVSRFTEYAQTMYAALGDRVKLWITHNEPWCAGILGYFRGVHAPGGTDLRAGLAASHHLLLSHGAAVQAFRQSGRPGRIGITLSLFHTQPFADTEEHRRVAHLSDGYTNRWYLDPVFRGAYPADTWELMAGLVSDTRFVQPDDLKTIGCGTDFLGVNYYTRRTIEATPGTGEFGWTVHDRVGAPTTDLGWEIVPSGLTALLNDLEAAYGPRLPIFITENGAVFNDEKVDGRVEDDRRVDFLARHFTAAHDAMQAGVNLQGYFVWSFMDNFEWAFGYRPRFGIVHVDYATLERTPKASARFLARVIADNGLVPRRQSV